MLTLLNIVSAIYGDPTLGSNMQFVITRLVIVDGYGNGTGDNSNSSSSSAAGFKLARDPIVVRSKTTRLACGMHRLT